MHSFITQLKSSGVLTDYNQIAVLCKSVKGDKIIGMVEYLEEHGIKVYSPRSEMFFERKEIKRVIGCMILVHAIESGERIELTSKYFSKKLLLALYEEGAFAPNQYNGYDGKNDYQFMLDMYNKRNKSNITEQQHRKIRGLIAYSIKPFLRKRLKYK